MKRYLIVFIKDGGFACKTVEAIDIYDALVDFEDVEEIYSVSLAR